MQQSSLDALQDGYFTESQQQSGKGHAAVLRQKALSEVWTQQAGYVGLTVEVLLGILS